MMTPFAQLYDCDGHDGQLGFYRTQTGWAYSFPACGVRWDYSDHHYAFSGGWVGHKGFIVGLYRAEVTPLSNAIAEAKHRVLVKRMLREAEAILG